MVKRVFDGLKNLLLKESAMVSTNLVFVTNMEVGASKALKDQRNYLVAAELGCACDDFCGRVA